MITFNSVRDIILDELKAKGYAPNPADVHLAVVKIMGLHKEEVEKAAGEHVPTVLATAAAARALDATPTTPAK